MEKNARHHGCPGTIGQNVIRRCRINYHNFGHGHSELLHREIQPVPGYTDILLILRYETKIHRCFEYSDLIINIFIFLFVLYLIEIFSFVTGVFFFRIRSMFYICVAPDILFGMYGSRWIRRTQQPSFDHIR